MAKYKSNKQHAPIDTDVQIPAAIRAAAARSEQLHQQMYQGTSEPPTPANDDPNRGNDGGDKQQPPAPQEQPNEPSAQPEEQPNPPAPEPAPQPAQPPAQQGSDADWQHRYNSLKGRYEAQERTIHGLNQRIADLEALLARSTATPPAQQRTPENTFQKLITPEDEETYGKDFISVAQRAAEEKLSPEIQFLKKQVDDLSRTLSGVAQTTEVVQKRTVYSYLDENIPNWRSINKDPKFVAWTNLPDPFSGAIRIELLRDAFNKGDGPRVLRFFQGFLADEAATDPVRREPDKPRETGKVPLSALAAPGRATTPAATQVPGEKETITHAQIANFYRLVHQGYYRGNEAEKERLEKMIFEAQREGRIV